MKNDQKFQTEQKITLNGYGTDPIEGNKEGFVYMYARESSPPRGLGSKNTLVQTKRMNGLISELVLYKARDLTARAFV